MALRYAIIGTGGIGGYYGGRLAKSGQEVHFLLRSDYEQAKLHGLRVESVNGDFVIQPMNAYNDSHQMPTCDVVLVCMKTTGNAKLKEILEPVLRPDSLVILIQNGLCIDQELAAAFPQTLIAGGTAFVCSFRIGPAHIRHAEYGALTFAPLQAEAAPLLKQVSADFEAAGVPITYEDDLNLIRWKKLVWNIPYNGLTVILNQATDRLTFDPASRTLIRALMEEVVEAAHYCGAEIPSSFIDKMFDLTEKMTPYSPSMRLDYDHHRPLEIQTMYSHPIRVAREHGYEMKLTQVLEKELIFLERFHNLV